MRIAFVVLFLGFHLCWSAYRWGNVAFGGGGFVSAVIAHPTVRNLFYARTDVGGAYRWEETTQSWIPLLDWTSIEETSYQGVEALAVDRRNPDALYLLVGTSYWNNGKTAILRSADRGNTFQITEVTSQFRAHGNGMGRQSGEKLAVDPNSGNILFCGTRANGLFKSTNSGASWSAVTSFPVTGTPNGNGIAFVLFDTTGGNAGSATQRLWVGVSQAQNNLYVSTNGGVSWSVISGGPTLVPQRAVQAGSVLYITYADSSGPWNMTTGALYKYDFAANLWTNISPMANTPFSGIAVAPNNHNFLVATTINKYLQQPWGWGDRIFVSTNGGVSWSDLIASSRVTMDANGFPWITNHAIHWAGSIAMDPYNPARVFITSGNGIFSTSNLSATAVSTWKFSVKGLEETVPLDIASLNNGLLFSVIGDYDGNIHSDPYTYTTLHNPSMGTTTGLAVAGSAQNILARVGSKIYRSTNTGSSWTELSKPSNASNGKLGLSADGSVLLWTPENTSTTYRTANAGGSWTTVSGLNFNAYPTGDPLNSAKFYAYNPSGGGFFISVDSGKTFTQSASLNTGGSKIIRAVPGREGDIWVALYGNGLTRSTNSGQTFTKISSVSACVAVGFGRAPAGSSFPAIYIWGTVDGITGLFRSDNQGASWERINDDAHEFGGPGNGQFVIGDMAVYGRVYMSTVGRGIIVGDLLSSSSSSATSSISPSSSNPVSSSSSISSSSNPVSSSHTPSSSTGGLAIQGEQFCKADGMEESLNGNFLGSGYLNLNNALSAEAIWALQSDQGRTVSLEIRYANGGTTDRPMQLMVNGTSVTPNPAFPPSGSWSSWTTQLVSINLVQGYNSIRLISLSASGGPNIDQLYFQGNGLTGASCEQASLTTPSSVPRRKNDLRKSVRDLLGRIMD